jgi:hypothetical protein
MPDPRPPPCPDQDRWVTVVRAALDSWSRTVRLCVIYLTMNVPMGVFALLIRH